MPREDAVVIDIVNACDRITRFIQGSTLEHFIADDQLQSAVLYQITLIGEAAGRLSDEFKAAHPGIPWPAVRAMRNILIHEYHRVDIGQAWQTAIHDIPELRRVLSTDISPDERNTSD